jgi:Peptidase A4 family
MTHPQAEATLAHMQTFEPPPPELDPLTAPASLLRQHGFPRRPDPTTEPELDRIWQRTFARPKTIIQAELAFDEVMSARNPLYSGSENFSPSGWGGVVVETSSLGYSPPEPATCVVGIIVVPEIYPVSGDPDIPLTVGFWVGLDGYTNGQVLQAGFAATITGTSVYYWAWTEWYPLGAVAVTNFALEAGDAITVVVSAPQPDQGSVYLSNERTGQATRIGITPPSGVTSIGASAEWIVEGISADLPNFFECTFCDTVAGTQQNAFDLSPDGIIANIGGSNGPLTQAIIASPTTEVVLWEGSA